MKTVIGLIITGLVTQAHAFSCFLTLAKDSCWTNYNVNVDVIDPTTNHKLITVTVPKGKSWAREPFTCQPGQKLIYYARFSPNFWQGQANVTYAAQRYWTLPSAVTNQETAWEISVCYPQAFSEVPFPPEASGNCQCNFKIIPPLKPQ